MVVGVLAFQGDFAEHIAVLHSMKVPALEVRTKDDLSKIDALIIPGGESTVMAQFLLSTGIGAEIKKRISSRRHPLVIYGTCAGAIVLARRATGKNAPKPLGLVNVTVARNAYGTQRESFEASLKVQGIKQSIDVAFIRAPKITSVGRGVEVLASYGKDPVLVKQERVLLGTFHPEVRGSTELHRMFLAMAKA